LKQLTDRLADTKADTGRRTAAAVGLGELKDLAGQRPLVATLRDSDAAVRQAAASALGAFEPPAAETVQALVRVLKEDKDDQTRASAAWAMKGAAAKGTTTELLRALGEDKAERVRAGAAYALRGAMTDPALLAALRAAFKDESWWVRVEAAMTVATLVPDDLESVTVLAAALELKEPGTSAVWYLKELGPRAAPAGAALGKLLARVNYEPNTIGPPRYILLSLSHIGPAAKPAVPALLAILGKDESYVGAFHTRNYFIVEDNLVAYALARVGPDVVPDLLKVLRETKDVRRRRAAVVALGFLGPPAKAAVAELEAEAKKLENKDEKTQDEQFLETAVTKALERIRDTNAVPVEKLE
jgi:HEAT repeat protein